MSLGMCELVRYRGAGAKNDCATKQIFFDAHFLSDALRRRSKSQNSPLSQVEEIHGEQRHARRKKMMIIIFVALRT